MNLKKLDEAFSRIQELDAQLSSLPTPEELENLQMFTEEVRRRINSDEWQPTPQNKREVLELLHVIVYVGENYTGKIVGWFGELEGLSSSTC